MTTPLKLKRIPGNTNLRYWHEATYGGYPLMLSKGPFIEQYLEKLYRVMLLALSDYRSVFAFRVDLNLPLGKKLSDDAMTNQVIERTTVPVEVIAGDAAPSLERVGIPAGVGSGFFVLWMAAD